MTKAIMYHYVRKYDNTYPYFSFLHVEEFCRQLDYFAANYNILHPAQLQQSVVNGTSAQSLVLTFDDGLKDHYQYVFPELQKRGLSAIFYVPTGIFDGSSILGVHRLHLLLGKVGGREVFKALLQIITPQMLNPQHIKDFSHYTYRCQVNDGDTQLVKRLLNYYISYQFRGQVLDTLMAYFFTDEKALLRSFYVTPQEVKHMHDAGMIIGSHTVSHPVMSKLTSDEQAYEVQTSLQQLEDITGGLHHRTFCYPHGGFHTFTPETEKILTGNKISYSFNVEPREVLADDFVNRPQALPRFDCNMFPHGKIYEHAA